MHSLPNFDQLLQLAATSHQYSVTTKITAPIATIQPITPITITATSS